jgi:hypothetical protein
MSLLAQRGGDYLAYVNLSRSSRCPVLLPATENIMDQPFTHRYISTLTGLLEGRYLIPRLTSTEFTR